MTLDKALKKVFILIKNNLTIISILVSFFALGVSIFNTYQIKNNGIILGNNGVPAVKVESPEKILKEIPLNAPFLGNPNAKLTVIEFADFQCPFCKRFFSETYPDIKKEYIDTGKIKFVYLDFAFLGEESTKAAEAAKCAGEQGKFWQYHDELFNNQGAENGGTFNDQNLKKFASNIGLNQVSFGECIASDKYSQMITTESALARKYGINGTPGFIIGNQVSKGAYSIDTYRQILDSQLK